MDQFLNYDQLEQLERVCQQCHSHISQTADVTVCPACGGALLPHPGVETGLPGTPPAEVDHRGIVLPRRHAVGGVITPR